MYLNNNFCTFTEETKNVDNSLKNACLDKLWQDKYIYICYVHIYKIVNNIPLQVLQICQEVPVQIFSTQYIQNHPLFTLSIVMIIEDDSVNNCDTHTYHFVLYILIIIRCFRFVQLHVGIPCVLISWLSWLHWDHRVHWVDHRVQWDHGVHWDHKSPLGS